MREFMRFLKNGNYDYEVSSDGESMIIYDVDEDDLDLRAAIRQAGLRYVESHDNLVVGAPR